MANGVLDQVVSRGGGCKCHDEPHHVVVEGKTGLAHRLGGEDQDRPVPEVDGVRGVAGPLEETEAQDGLGPAGRTEAPPAMTRALPITGTATNAPGYVVALSKMNAGGHDGGQPNPAH